MTSTSSMDNLKIECGKKYIIKGYNPTIDKTYRHHLLAMGLIPGGTFLVRRFAPFSKTAQIDLEQFSLSLRDKELRALLFEPLNLLLS